MAFNGTGTFTRLYNWVTDKTNSVPITASRMDAETDGIATALSNCITKDGQTTVTANIPMASHKFTGLSVGSARTDSITLGQVQDGQFTYLGTTGGSADAYTATPNPAISAYVATMQYSAKIAATNLTTTPYLQISGIGTPASDAVIKKLGADKSEVAVVAGDMVANGIYKFQRNTGSTAWIILNPENQISNAINDSAAINNLGLAASVAANALTIALKTKAGTDPSTSDPVKISFRNATLTTGTYNTRSSVAATSIVISSGSTLGSINAAASNIYVYALDNAGSIELGVSLAKLEDHSIQSSTSEGGAGAADSATTLYSATARSNIPIRLIGVITSTQATAGTWASSPTIISLCPALNTTVVQIVNTQTSAFASGTTLIPFDDSPPQITEGNEYMTLAITPKSATNKLKIDVVFNFNHSAVSAVTAALFQDSVVNALAAASFTLFSGSAAEQIKFTHYMTASTTSSTTFRVRGGSDSAGTTQFNGNNSGRRLGGVMASSITITEIQT